MKSVFRVMVGIGLVCVAGLGVAHMESHDGCEGFVPANTMKIPVGWKAPVSWKSKVLFSNHGPQAQGGLTEQQFNDVLDRIEKLYGDEIHQAGGNLKMNRLWNDETVNASAQRYGGTWVVNMYGGLARHPEVTIEGFALVACHETGHHLGGAPKIHGWFGDDWATNEGGADYFATLKCLRRFFAEDDNKAITANAGVEVFAHETCKSQFTSEKDQLVCERVTLAGQSVAGLFMNLRKERTRPNFDTPDTRIVRRMNDNHPATQCRMDTYFSGAVCHVDHSVANSDKDYKQGACVEGVDAVGYRPRCWFKPADDAKDPDDRDKDSGRWWPWLTRDGSSQPSHEQAVHL